MSLAYETYKIVYPKDDPFYVGDAGVTIQGLTFYSKVLDQNEINTSYDQAHHPGGYMDANTAYLTLTGQRSSAGGNKNITCNCFYMQYGKKKAQVTTYDGDIRAIDDSLSITVYSATINDTAKNYKEICILDGVNIWWGFTESVTAGVDAFTAWNDGTYSGTLTENASGDAYDEVSQPTNIHRDTCMFGDGSFSENLGTNSGGYISSSDDLTAVASNGAFSVETWWAFLSHNFDQKIIDMPGFIVLEYFEPETTNEPWEAGYTGPYLKLTVTYSTGTVVLTSDTGAIDETEARMHHFVVTADGVDSAELYLNGELLLEGNLI